MHAQIRRTGRAVVCTGLLSSAAGCGGAAPATTGPTAPQHSRGPTFATSRFSVDTPAGWRNEIANKNEVARYSQNGTVLLLFEASPPGRVQPNVNDVTANINVVLAGAPVPDDQLAFYLTSVSQSGATDLTQPEPFQVDGRAGVYITYDSNISGTPGESRDMVVNYKGDTYDITMNTSRYAFPLQLPALTHTLESWKWQG